MFKSTDGGASWTSILANVPSSFNVPGSNAVFYSIDCYDANNFILSCGIRDTGLGLTVLAAMIRSNDGGSSYTEDSIGYPQTIYNYGISNVSYTTLGSAWGHTSANVVKYELETTGIGGGPTGPTVIVSPKPATTQFTITIEPPFVGSLNCITAANN